MLNIKDFYFQSSTGKNTIRARICVPQGEPRGVVQIAHGIVEHIGRYDAFMTALAEAGYVAVGNDHLGHGLSVRTSKEQGIFNEKDGWKNVVRDMKRLHSIMERKYPGIPQILIGHSMGSFLSRTYLIVHPHDFDAAVLIGTDHVQREKAFAGYILAQVLTLICGADKRGNLLNKIAFGAYNSGIKNERTAYDWLSRDPEQVDKFISDPYCGFVPRIGLFRDMLHGVGIITEPANIRRMDSDMPVLIIGGSRDPVGEYGVGIRRTFRAFAAAGMRKIQWFVYPGARHELLNELGRDRIVSDIIGWLDKAVDNR